MTVTISKKNWVLPFFLPQETGYFHVNLHILMQIRAVRPSVRYRHPCRRCKVLSAQGNPVPFYLSYEPK